MKKDTLQSIGWFFPDVFEEATTTANVAYYPVPLGSLRPSDRKDFGYGYAKKKKKTEGVISIGEILTS